MKTLKTHLNDSLKNERFKELYEEEKELLNVSLMLQKAREQAGFSQKELAAVAHLTQQQVSKIENGENCNIMTYLKASRAIGLNFSLVRSKKQRVKG